jgi:hypothetical protein
MAFWWVCGGMLVLVGAVVLRDRSTRHKVIRAMARSWERRQGRGSVSRKKAKARAHLRERKATAKNLPQAHRPFERPRRPRLVATKCTAACRTSRKPAYDRKTGRLLCDCPCGGREHGMYRPGATSKPAPPRRAAGSSGAKRPAAPASTPKPARSAPMAAGPEKKATTGTLERPKTTPVRPVSPSAPPPPPQTWRGLQQKSWEAMKAHAEKQPGCAGGTFSAKTFRDRRHNPPRVTQQMSCDTCGKAVS